jgi:hypothetical protein
VIVRPFDPRRRGERSWVLSTWVRSYGHDRAGMPRRAYADFQGRLVETLLSAARSRVVVVCSERDPDALHAWACGVTNALHYAYTPPELRGSGLARAAIAAALGTYGERIETTHRWPFRSERFAFNPTEILEAA